MQTESRCDRPSPRNGQPGGRATARLALVFLAGLCMLGVTTRAADVYRADPVHSHIGFAVKHLGLSKVHGEFTEYQADISVDGANPESVSAQATIQANSVDTGSEGRDTHLRGTDFFDVESHPTIRFRSKRIEETDDGPVMHGVLTIRDTSQEVEIPFELTGPVEDPWGKHRLGLSGRLTIDRHDYGVGADKPTDTMIGNEVYITIDVEAVAGAEPEAPSPGGK